MDSINKLKDDSSESMEQDTAQENVDNTSSDRQGNETFNDPVEETLPLVKDIVDKYLAAKQATKNLEFSQARYLT